MRIIVVKRRRRYIRCAVLLRIWTADVMSIVVPIVRQAHNLKPRLLLALSFATLPSNNHHPLLHSPHPYSLFLTWGLVFISDLTGLLSTYLPVLLSANEAYHHFTSFNMPSRSLRLHLFPGCARPYTNTSQATGVSTYTS